NDSKYGRQWGGANDDDEGGSVSHFSLKLSSKTNMNCFNLY
ncbi:4537_t:CDS:1, partial [Funneliformis mosseae]